MNFSTLHFGQFIWCEILPRTPDVIWFKNDANLRDEVRYVKILCLQDGLNILNSRVIILKYKLRLLQNNTPTPHRSPGPVRVLA